MDRMNIDERIYNDLPESLKGLTSLFEGREKDVVLISSLGVLSGCLPKVYGIYGAKKVYANLYFMIVAPPASGKGAINYSLGLVESIHNKIKNDSQKIADECMRNKDINNYDCPGVKSKVIPGNISSSQIYSSIADSHFGSIIVESEADTITNAIKNDWGNFSDVLRKAFHHETISISRKMDNLYLEIKEPKLSMVLSGTPDQTKPFVKTKENGLFSRFMFFNFDNYQGWKNVFEEKEDLSLKFKEVGDSVIYPMYVQLFQHEEEIEFKFAELQIHGFNKLMTKITQAVKKNHPEGFISNVRRHGLILFRISMVLTLLRKYESGLLNLKEPVICDNIDFEIACSITETLLRHALVIYDELSETLLNEQDEDLLFALNETFTRKDAIDLATKQKIPERTMDEKLKQWRKKKVIRKVSHGKYKRNLG